VRIGVSLFIYILSLSLSPEEPGQVDAKKVTKENYSQAYLFFKGAHECKAFKDKPDRCARFISCIIILQWPQ
jgi:hypothetical protein